MRAPPLSFSEVVDVTPHGSVAGIPTFYDLIKASTSTRLSELLAHELPPTLRTLQALHALYTSAVRTVFPEETPEHLGQLWARYHLTANYIRLSLTSFLHHFSQSSSTPTPSDRQSATNMARWVELKLASLTTDCPTSNGQMSWADLAQEVLRRW